MMRCHWGRNSVCHNRETERREMSSYKTLCPESSAVRKLPMNYDQADRGLFEHELTRTIPATVLLNLHDVKVNPDGILSRGAQALPESFVSQHFLNAWMRSRAGLKFLVRNCLFRHHSVLDQDVIWFTDNWSKAYFHWMTDALPRLLAIQGELANATILLPGSYQQEEYIRSSLAPFAVQTRWVNEVLLCRHVIMPSPTAPTGNYNEDLVRGLRSLYHDLYQNTHYNRTAEKIYISRGKAQRRKITNEEEVIAVMKEFGFETIYFEDHSFEQQAKIAMNARYMVSNHGAGLTNMLFMRSGSSVCELRKKGDALNNCYFALASALKLKYFYQICDSDSPHEDAHMANLIVDGQLLRRNIDKMLSN